MKKPLSNNTHQIFKNIADNNDKEAFGRFFHEYYSNLLQFAMLYVPHFEQAEDIVSNVMVRLIKKAKDISEIENLENFLFVSVKNESLDYLKKEKKRQYVAIDSENDFFLKEQEDPHEKLIEKELRNLIFKTVENFPPKRRMVYKLIKDENLKYKEVAKLMDISERTIGVHMTMAGKEIKKVLDAYLDSKSGNQRYMNVARMLLPLFIG